MLDECDRFAWSRGDQELISVDGDISALEDEDENGR